LVSSGKAIANAVIDDDDGAAGPDAAIHSHNFRFHASFVAPQ
jgi:hypothetical protein